MAKLLCILLQRNDPRYSWGFTVRGGGGQLDCYPLIDQVTAGSLADRHLAPGDTILKINDVDSRSLGLAQVERIINQPSKSLDLKILQSGARTASSCDSGTFSRATASPDRRSLRSQPSKTYISHNTACGRSTWSGRDLRTKKQDFWKDIVNEKPDDCREGFTRMVSGANSPFRSRMSRYDRWRGLSEGRATDFEDSQKSFSDEVELRKNYMDSSYRTSNIHSIWSPTPFDRLRTPTSDYSEEKMGGNYERQGDMTFWDYSPERESSEPRTVRSGSSNRVYRRHHSDLGHDFSSLSSGYASNAKSTFRSTDSPFDDAFISDFWESPYSNQTHVRYQSTSSPTKNIGSVWKNTNMSSKSEFKKSTSISEKTYSSAEGAKLYESYEHLNKTKESEKSSKTVDGGVEEVVEKTKRNKEYILANRDDRTGQPQETKKIVNDFKVVERMVDGDHEFCNKIKERSEVVSNSSTPVNFYDNVQQPSIQKAEWRNSPVNRQQDVKFVNNGERDDFDSGPVNFSPIVNRRWANSTPIPDEDEIPGYAQEPLQETYFEVDIRSPLENQQIYRSKEEFLRKQSSQISGGGSPIPVSPQGDTQVAPPPPPPPCPPPPLCPPAPPPPPPPGLPGSIPTVRLSSEIPDKRRSAYEPPAAIQNAMMTKDKKPFTYTPGGLDLSEIRSPRMARRISRNANAPDLAPSQPRPVSVPGQPLPPSAVAAMQPQIAIPVLPQGGGVSQLHHITPGGHSGPSPPPPPPQPRSHPISPLAQSTPSSPPQPTSPQKAQPSSPQSVVPNRQPSPPPMAVPKLQPQHRHTKSEPQSTPGSIYVPPIEPQQSQSARAQLGSLYIPPLEAQDPSKPQSPASQLNKAPTPWLSRQPSQVQKVVPPWVNRESAQSPQPQQHMQMQSPPQTHYLPQGQPQTQHLPQGQPQTQYLPQGQPQTQYIPQGQPQTQYLPQGQPQTRIIPIQIEGKEPAHPNERIIPIQLEGTPTPTHTQQQPNFGQPQNTGRQTPQTPRWMNQQPVYVHNKFNQGSQSPVPTEQYAGDSQPSWRHSQTNGTMQSPGPVQSQSFKVLQKITGTENDGEDQSDMPYNSQGVPLSQLRKLQLSDDDRALMNKVKSQVDDETFLHNESDPRYRGSAIPSRAFRILQTMTDSAGEDSDVPRTYSPVQPGQNRQSVHPTSQTDSPQQYIPPSEQQVQEPRKYTGGAIPSRSFRMLQAMTAGSESPDRPGESEY